MGLRWRQTSFGNRGVRQRRKQTQTSQPKILLFSTFHHTTLKRISTNSQHPTRTHRRTPRKPVWRVQPARARVYPADFAPPRAVVCVSSRVFYFTGLRVLEFGFLVSSLANRTTSHTTHRSVVSCEGTRANSFDCCWVLQRLRFESLGIERCARTYAYAAGILNEFPTLLRRFGLRGTNRTVTACLAQRST